MLRRGLVSLILLAVPFLPAAAAPLTFELDPKATSVEITFGATLHTVKGSLRARQGTLRVDPGSGQISGWVVLDATSAQTGNARRDRKMHEKILESKRYPDILFDIQRLSGQLRPTGRSEIQLHGTLEMHGVRRPFALPAVLNSDGRTVTATGTVIVRYLEWGIADPSFFILRVAKEMRVTVKAAGHLSG